MAQVMQRESRIRSRQWVGILPILLVAVLAISIKWVYLQTAESGYSAEELPLAPMALVAGNQNISDVSLTRLYGTVSITTALSLKAFGFSVFSIKLPNLLFFFATLIFLYLAAVNLLGNEKRSYALVPVILLALGPPVMQVWGMKNRGGFIENLCAFAFCVWVVSRKEGAGLTQLAKFTVAIVVGLAAWSQPMAIVWGAVVIAYVIALDLDRGFFCAARSVPLVLLGVALGLMPLIAMNFLYNFNTIKVIDAGELVSGADLGRMGRLRELLSGGMPRLLGLKEQWNTQWLLPAAMGRAMYLLLMLPVIFASLSAVLAFLKTRTLRIDLMLLSSIVAVIAVNVVSSWGNFQLEPRRLLVLYVPFVLLTTIALSKSRSACILYVAMWLSFSAWANFVYIEKNKAGFSHPMYVPLDDVAKFLREHQIKGIYTDAWTGGRVTFASHGNIAWFKSEYIPTAYGFVSDSVFEPSEAFLFNPHYPGGREQKESFIGDLERATVHCRIDEVQQITIVHQCEGGALDLIQLPYAVQPREPGSEIADFPIVDERVKTLVGVKADGVLRSTGSAGYVMYGPYYGIGSGRYKVVVEGKSSTPFTIDAVAWGGKSILASKNYPGSALSADASLADLSFELSRPARDLEIRILVPEGSDTSIDAYKITRQ